MQLGSIISVNVQETSPEALKRRLGTPFSRDLHPGVKSYMDVMLHLLVQHRILEYESPPDAGVAPLHSQNLHVLLPPQSFEPKLLHGW